MIVGKTESPAASSSKEGDLCIKEDEVPEPDLSPKARPRSKSDRFSRPSRKQVVDVYKQVSSCQLGANTDILQRGFKKLKSYNVQMSMA